MEGCQPNVVTYNTLVDLYGKIGRSADAVATLDTMQMHVSPFLAVTWPNKPLLVVYADAACSKLHIVLAQPGEREKDLYAWLRLATTTRYTHNPSDTGWEEHSELFMCSRLQM